MARHANNKYRPEYCDLLVEMMSKGSAFIEFCAAVKVSKQTFYLWRDRYPAFKEAHELATSLAEAHWVKKGEENAGNPDFNAAMYHFQMGSRFGIGKTRKIKVSKITKRDKPIKQPKTIMDRFDNAMLDFDDGEVSIEEFNQAVNAFMNMATLAERDELAQRVQDIEKRLKAKNCGRWVEFQTRSSKSLRLCSRKSSTLSWSLLTTRRKRL